MYGDHKHSYKILPHIYSWRNGNRYNTFKCSFCGDHQLVQQGWFQNSIDFWKAKKNV